ncbi:hypothetical protein ABZ468_53475 [Streptomyces sp. NPDC005708]|uniref:hypothetical protein n=1 Tax=Streptomyces sp. NPDC005708 TaxID=3154564 RepID=UPI0033C597BF
MGPDSSLTFTWDERYRDTPGSQTVIPDEYDWFAIGGLWPWDEWEDHHEATPGQEAFANGALHYLEADGTEAQDEPLKTPYARGRAEAHAVTLHMEEYPDQALRRALAVHGLTAYLDEDCGNSWLRIPFDQTRDWDGVGWHLVVFVMVDGDDATFVDEPVGDRAAHWHLNRGVGDGTGRETRLLVSPYTAADQVAEVIAALLRTPQRHEL